MRAVEHPIKKVRASMVAAAMEGDQKDREEVG